MKNTVQTCGTFDGDYYSITVAIGDIHTITLDGLSKDDMLELKSCVDCMLIEDEQE